MRSDLPSGTVTFLFTDVEGSTKLLHQLGAEGYADALAEHRQVIRKACAAEGGVEVDTQGDAFFFAFPTAHGALRAASAFTDSLAAGAIQVRVGLHTGAPLLTDEGYVGDDVHRAARIAAAGHGGQVLVSAATAELVGVELEDLGEHRLKDLSDAERVFQLGTAAFAPLKSLYLTNLPVPATPFLGREHELAEVAGLLADTRLLTLTGPGGTGKTRLALQAVAAAADAYPDGVFWVPLATLRDPELVLASASQALGALNGLAEHIRDKQLLVLFDNFEHVIAAAPALSDLLRVCPNLKLVVTSREPLHLAAEQEYAVPPFVHEEGVGFFLAKARMVDPDFAPDENVSEICRRLDDLPLALELAAARVKALTSAQILERLERSLPLLTGGPLDMPERQRTLQATIEWSYELLTEDEQRRFARLAVFRGGCTLDAAQEVCDADLDTLQSLVAKSLVRFSNGRYWMLETIREYALERLAGTPDVDDISQGHAEWFLAFAEAVPPPAPGREYGPWLDRLDLEHDNLRAALDWFEERESDEEWLQLVAALARFWMIRGHGREGQRRIERALAIRVDASQPRATVLDLAAGLALDDADPARARRYAAESLALRRELGDGAAVGRTLLLLAQASADAGDFDAACMLAQESADTVQEIGDDDRLRSAMHELGWMTLFAGDRERARSIVATNLERARFAGDDWNTAGSLQVLAVIATADGELADAGEMLRESYALNREIGYPFGIAFDLDYLAAAAAAGREPEVAARVMARAELLRSEIGVHIRPADARVSAETLSSVRAQLTAEEVAAAWTEGSAMTVDAVVEHAVEALRDA